jgi:ribosomal protein S5
MSLSIKDVKVKHEARLMALPGVVSVGIGRAKDGTSAIIVGLDAANPNIATQIPQSLEDYPVVVQVIGTIKPH